MLQNIRDKTHGWWVWVIVPVLILVFALFGIQNYLGSSFSQNEVAKVNGTSISVATFSTLYQSINNSENNGQNPQLASALKVKVLQTLVSKLILSQGLQKLGFAVSDASLSQMIYQIPAFQQNGQFSMPLYQTFLERMGESTEGIKTDLQQTYLINQFQTGLNLSQFTLPNEITAETNYANLMRDITYVTVSANNFIPKTPPSDNQITAYYAAHQAQFASEVQVKLAYITLSLSQFKTTGADANTAEANYSAALNQAANLAFQNANSLDPVAKAMNVDIQTTAMTDTSHLSGILANKNILAAVLSNSVLKQGNNSNVIPLSAEEAVILRIVASVPPKPLPLAQVKVKIIDQIQTQAALEAAKNAVNGILNAVNQGGNLNELIKAYGLNTQNATGINQSSKNLSDVLVNRLMSVGLDQAVAVSLSESSFGIAKVTRVYPNSSAASHPVTAQSIINLWTQVEAEEALLNLQSKAKVSINQALFKQN